MSRRHSRRTVIEANTPQAWYAHWWKDEWAEETLTICEKVYHTQRRTLIHGAYATTQWKNIDDHFREWLVEKALEFRSQVNVFTVTGDLEDSWYRMLHANLTRMSKYHFFHYCREHGIHADEPAHAYTTQSTDYLTEELGDAWVGDRYKQNNDILYKDPEHVIILLEQLLAGPTVDDMMQALKDPALCEWEGCQRRKEKRDWCSNHYRQYRTLWGIGDAAECSEEGCPDYASHRGWCTSHYDKHRRKLMNAGKWEPIKPIDRTQPCSTDGCENPIGERGNYGMCLRHYRQQVEANAPECKIDGCDNRANGSKGMCRSHYGADRRARAPECSIEGCNKKVRSRSRCKTHYDHYLKARKEGEAK